VLRQRKKRGGVPTKKEGLCSLRKRQPFLAMRGFRGGGRRKEKKTTGYQSKKRKKEKNCRRMPCSILVQEGGKKKHTGSKGGEKSTTSPPLTSREGRKREKREGRKRGALGGKGEKKSSFLLLPGSLRHRKKKNYLASLCREQRKMGWPYLSLREEGEEKRGARATVCFCRGSPETKKPPLRKKEREGRESPPLFPPGKPELPMKAHC